MNSSLAKFSTTRLFQSSLTVFWNRSLFLVPETFHNRCRSFYLHAHDRYEPIPKTNAGPRHFRSVVGETVSVRRNDLNSSFLFSSFIFFYFKVNWIKAVTFASVDLWRQQGKEWSRIKKKASFLPPTCIFLLLWPDFMDSWLEWFKMWSVDWNPQSPHDALA